MTPSQEQGNLEKAREEVERRGARIVEMERAHRRLEHLYEISKLLARFDDVERSVVEVIALVAETLPVQSAILILRTAGLPRTIFWQAEGDEEQPLQAAMAHAEASYGYLARATDVERDEARRLRFSWRPAQGPEPETESERRFIVLPLVVDHGGIFGVLQLEGDASWDEKGLIFVNAVVNQLAIAVDRQAVMLAQQAAAEASEREQRLLAQVGMIVTSSLDRRATLAAVARCAVPLFADLCIIDDVADDGTFQRLEVLFADDEKQGKLADRIRHFAPLPGWKTPEARVLEAGKALLFSEIIDPAEEGIAQGSEHANVMRAAGVRSMMALPLHARKRTLGVLTFVGAESGRRYSKRDLAVAEEFARRVATGIDNAWLYEQARRATRARDDLMAIVSHDLKNPLSAILIGIASITQDPSAGDPARFRKHLERMERGAQRMSRLIQDLLDTASIQGGRLSVAATPLEVAPQIAEALETMQTMAASKCLCLESKLPAEIPAVCADSARFQQVLVNLLSNAIKFTTEGGTISVGAEASEGIVTFSVRDTGPGIAEADVSRLFDRFWQARRTARLGTGLGLFIVKGIVETHGGKIWVESKLGVGSTFFFTLPAAASRADEPRPESVSDPIRH
jgi:signal transduction histidine kinase